MRWLKLILSVVIFGGGFALIGAGASPVSEWWGMFVLGSVGVLIGLAAGGNPDWKFWDYIFGPKEEGQEDD